MAFVFFFFKILCHFICWLNQSIKLLLHDPHTCSATTSVLTVLHFFLFVLFTVLFVSLSFSLSFYRTNLLWLYFIVLYCFIRNWCVFNHYWSILKIRKIIFVNFVFDLSVCTFIVFLNHLLLSPFIFWVVAFLCPTTFSTPCPHSSFIYFIFRPLTSYNKRESCASSATTTTLLGPPPGNYISQRGSNGALHLYAMPRAISPLMQVNCACARVCETLISFILLELT